MNKNLLKKYYDVILSPVITEKSTRARENGCITFVVRKDADKACIKKAVESIFSAQVLKVNTLNVRGHHKIVRNRKGFSPGFKKAMVRLAKTESVDKVMGN